MLRAVIFDFDGVIVDTERLHFQALKRVLAEEGIPLAWEEYTQAYLAMDDKNCFRTVLARHGRAIAPGIVDGLSERKAHYFFDTLSDAVTLFPGVEGLIRECAGVYPRPRGEPVSPLHKCFPARGADRRPLRFEEPGAGRPATDY